MAKGVLAQTILTDDNEWQLVYSVPAGLFSSFTALASNGHPNPVRLDLAVANSSSNGFANSVSMRNMVDRDVVLDADEVFERNGLVLGPSEKLFMRVFPGGEVSVTVMGIEGTN